MRKPAASTTTDSVGGPFISDPLTGHDHDSSVRIPRSSNRGTRDVYAKLVTRVNPSLFGGFAFEGPLPYLKPGARIQIPPAGVVLLLECAGNTGLTESGQRARGYNRSTVLYVLWRWHRQSLTWCELARAASVHSDFSHVLAPAAQQALGECPRAPTADISEFADRFTAQLDDKLRDCTDEERRKLVAVLHDRIAARAA